jgi:hypothetical protein
MGHRVNLLGLATEDIDGKFPLVTAPEVAAGVPRNSPLASDRKYPPEPAERLGGYSFMSFALLDSSTTWPADLKITAASVVVSTPRQHVILPGSGSL